MSEREQERTSAVALAAVLGLIALLLVARLPAGHEPALHLPAVAFILLFAGAQASVVHVQVLRQSVSVCLGSVAGVIGLAFCTPREFVLGTTLGSMAVLLMQRKQSWSKLLFNLALFGVTWAASRTVFEHIGAGGPPTDIRFMVAASAAVVTGILVSVLGVAAVMLASSRRLDVRAVGRTCGLALLLDGAAGGLGILAVLLAVHAPYGLPLLAAVVLLLVLGARAHSALDWRHRRMTSLYQFTSSVSAVDDLRALAVRICDEARDILHCDAAELMVRTSTGLLRAELGADGTPVVTVGPAPADNPWRETAVADLATGHALRVPLMAGGTQIGTLCVRGRWRYLGAFGPEDLRLCSSLADHAAVALQGALLLERVRDDAAERRRQALHDPVTGLWNRRGLVEAAETRTAAPLGLLVLDLVGFSDVNDTLGQLVGDQLLQHVGQSLGAVAGVRSVARFGNDEFGVLIDGFSDAVEGVGRARRVLAQLEQPLAVHNLTLQVQTQAGLVLAPAGGDAALLAHRADAALAAAKRSGLALHVYDSTDDEQNARRVRLVSDLRRAVAADALDVHYQPKLDPRTGRVLGVEALARWMHPTEGFVPPDVFIPLAEQAGLIPALTASVLRLALASVARWRAHGHPLTVAVNLSARLLRDPGVPKAVAAALDLAGVPPEALTLEITESAVMEDVVTARAVLEELRALGITLSLDDFGTGHSSLAYLATLPVSELKLDKSFILELPQDQTSLAIVRAAIDLAHQLGLTVVAEGVETGEAQDLLVSRNCDVVQGYFHSRPLPAPAFEEWLEALPLEAGSGSPSAAR